MLSTAIGTMTNNKYLHLQVLKTDNGNFVRREWHGENKREQSLGNYVEAHLLEKLGVVAWLQGPYNHENDRWMPDVPVYGYKVTVNGEVLEFRVSHKFSVELMEEKVPGELLRLGSTFITSGRYNWFALTVNGESIGPKGRFTVPELVHNG